MVPADFDLASALRRNARILERHSRRIREQSGNRFLPSVTDEFFDTSAPIVPYTIRQLTPAELRKERILEMRKAESAKLAD